MGSRLYSQLRFHRGAFMTTVLRRCSALLVLGLLSLPSLAGAQYFGRNKVQYETFKWRILKSDHFDNFFYPPESLIVSDAARMAERWYARHSETFRHAFDRKSLIFYADHPDFEQTNVVGEQLEEGTGGVTEGLRTRVIMPFTGIYKDNDHVLGHELVHVFQYNIAEAAPGGGLARLNALPLWLIEGMAEYFSLGRQDELTAMWMRDAVMRDKFPTIKQLTTDPRFFPYRYGQALWAYVGGRWGDRSIVDLYRNALRIGWDQALIRTLGENSDSLSKDWAAANKAMYLPVAQGRSKPDSVGEEIIGLRKKTTDQNVSPELSPDGNLVAFYSTRNLFSIDLFVADAHTGRIIKQLAGPESDPHFDAISWINSSGAWSPDASHFAFIVYAEGNNEIALLNARDGNVERRIKLGPIGAVSSIAWSPDGKTLAFSGQKGGISDLYLLDLASGNIRQLTNDRYADIQPSWSPDGTKLAFATDRGPTTDFNTMRFGELQLATIDVASGQITVYSPFAKGKHINPQWSPDGRSLFFVGDPDGISDLFRFELASGQVFRLTHVATGVSGITTISPAISVAQRSGRVAFTVFQAQGFTVHAFEAADTHGTPVDLQGQVAAGDVLPPGDVTNSIVTAYLNDPTTGLVSGRDFQVVAYHPSFSLDALGQPSVGVASGPFGTGVAGGVSAFFGDQLSDQQIATVIQANGTVKDIGGELAYYNLKHRWNYGASIMHLPYLTGGVFYDTATTPGAAYSVNQVLERIYVDQASLITQYPFSSTRRLELSMAATRLGYEYEIQRIEVDQIGDVVGHSQTYLPAPPPLYYAEPSAAYVGDNSVAAFTSPVAGSRYRFEVSPTIGTLTYTTALADYRKYFFMRPLTFAVRGLHYGRYGKDSETGRLSPLYLGEEMLVRGYGWGSFTPDECVSSNQNSCPVIDRMFGSRLLVANAELRIPLFGTSEWGLLNVPFLPTEIAPFFDAGIAYTQYQHPDWRFTTASNDTAGTTCGQPSQQQSNDLFSAVQIQCADRIPVFSTGVSARINFLGYMILEAYVAHPFQRPKKNWVVGFQLAPGW